MSTIYEGFCVFVVLGNKIICFFSRFFFGLVSLIPDIFVDAPVLSSLTTIFPFLSVFVLLGNTFVVIDLSVRFLLRTVRTFISCLQVDKHSTRLSSEPVKSQKSRIGG